MKINVARSNADYLKLKGFLLFFVERFLKFVELPESEKVTSRIARLELEGAMNTAYDSVLQGVNDCVEMSIKMGPDEVLKLDDELRLLGVMTLSEIRLKYSKSFARLLKRGSIKYPHEFYMAKGILGLPAEDLGDGVKSVLQDMTFAYESSVIDNIRSRGLPRA